MSENSDAGGGRMETHEKVEKENAIIRANDTKPEDTKPIFPTKPTSPNVGFAISRRFRCHVANCAFPAVSKRTKKCWWHSHMNLTERERWQKYEEYLAAKYGDYISFKRDLMGISNQIGNLVGAAKGSPYGPRKSRKAESEVGLGLSFIQRAKNLKSWFEGLK